MTHEADPFDNTEVAGILGAALPPVEPPAHLRAQILTAAARTPQVSMQTGGGDIPAASCSSVPAGAPIAAAYDAAAFAPAAVEAVPSAETMQSAPADNVHALPSTIAAGASSAPSYEGDGQVLPLRRRSTTRRVLGGFARVAAAFALVAVGVGVGRWSAMDSMDSTMSYAKLNQMQDVARMEHTMADGHVATLTWSADMEMTALTLPSQMEAPAGHILQVWKRINGVVAPAGTYAPDRGAVFSFIDAMPEPGLEVFITLEPAGGSSQPTSKPLVVLRVSENAMPETVTERGGGTERSEVTERGVSRDEGVTRLTSPSETIDARTTDVANT